MNQPQSSTRNSFQENLYTIEERHALLSESLKPVVRHARQSEPQYQPAYKIFPPLQQELFRTRHPSKNQSQNTPSQTKWKFYNTQSSF